MTVTSHVTVVAPRKGKVMFLKEKKMCYKMVYYILCLG